MRRGLLLLLLVGTLATLGVVTAASVWWWTDDEAGVEHVVQRGDTLFLIARAYGVTVDELRAWNGVEGDLIEVGQVLSIRSVGEPVAAAPRPSPAPGAAPRPPGAPSLRLPPEQPCLVGPGAEGLGDRGMIAHDGLSYGQVKQAMDAFLPNTLRCLPDAGASGSLDLEITVACSGRVGRVVVQRTSMGPEVTRCVVDVLKFAPFPAHDLPDGATFRYPLTFGG